MSVCFNCRGSQGVTEAGTGQEEAGETAGQTERSQEGYPEQRPAEAGEGTLSCLVESVVYL